MGGSASNARYDGEEEETGDKIKAKPKNKNQDDKRQQQKDSQTEADEENKEDIARQLEWEATLAAAIERGMPDPEFDEYKGWAYPISWAELVRNTGWDKSEHGLPVYVTLRNFGASQILASMTEEPRDKWYVVIVFYVPKTLDDDLGEDAGGTSVQTPYGRIKWGIPWKVRSNHVEHVPAVVRGITRPRELSGGVAASILKRNICQAKTTSAELKHVVVTLKWLDFLAADKHPGSAENFALRLFKRDYANYFTTDEDTTTTSAAAQRRSCCEDQAFIRAPSINWNGVARADSQFSQPQQQSWQQQLFPVYSECELRTTPVNVAEPPIKFV